MTTELEIRVTGCGDEDRLDALHDALESALAGVGVCPGYDVSFDSDGDPGTVFPVTATEETAARTILQALVDAFAMETGARCAVRNAAEPDDRPPPATRIL